ncbi:MAG: transcriptional regulator [Bacteroidota bacterium]
MKDLKRVEIVTGTLDTPKVVSILEDNKVSGYTMIKNVLGSGEKGFQDGEGLHNAFQNTYIIVACSTEEFDNIKEPLRKVLSKSGGVCLVSDAKWLVH